MALKFHLFIFLSSSHVYQPTRSTFHYLGILLLAFLWTEWIHNWMERQGSLCMVSEWSIMVYQILWLCTMATPKFGSFSKYDFGDQLIICFIQTSFQQQLHVDFVCKSSDTTKSSCSQPEIHSRVCTSYNLQPLIRKTTQCIWQIPNSCSYGTTGPVNTQTDKNP